jgi:hypothetical protein
MLLIAGDNISFAFKGISPPSRRSSGVSSKHPHHFDYCGPHGTAYEFLIAVADFGEIAAVLASFAADPAD